jgi:membrane protease YdiL (CAAX protease family)
VPALHQLRTPTQLDRTVGHRPRGLRWLRLAVARHPITAFLVLVFVFSTGLAIVPVITEPGLLPGGATLMGPLTNILGSMVPAFVVTAILSGRDGVRELTRRCLLWRVPMRWFAIALLGMPTATLLVATALYGLAPLRALAEGWPLLFTSFLPTLLVMIVFYNVAEEAGWTGFVFARLQDRHGPLRAALVTTVFFWLFHLPTFVVETDSWVLAGVLMGVLLLPHLASRFIVGWLYDGAGASVLIAGLFHATFNSTINPTGFALGVLKLPSDEAFTVLNAMVVLAGLAVVAATRGRLGRRSAERGRTATPAP